MATSKKRLFLKDDALTLCEREAPESEHRISQKKKKQKLNTNDKHKEKVEVYRSWGVPNFFPVFSEGKDEETMKVRLGYHSER